MMKKLILFLITSLLISFHAISQRDNELPVIIQINSQFGPLNLEISTNCATDNLKVFVNVVVYFDDIINDITKNLKMKYSYISFLTYIRNDSRVFLSRTQNIDDHFDKCIWDACAAQFNEWMRAQPWELLYEREKHPEGYNALSYLYSITLVPEK